jgi:anti-sigma-K factor RskA
MTWDEIKELGPLYAIGALDENTARTVEDFLQRATPEQKREIEDWREIVALIPTSLPAPVPPEYLKDRLLIRIAEEAQATVSGEDGAQSPPPLAETKETSEPAAKVLPFTTARREESPTTRWLLIAATVLLTCASGYLLWQNYQLNNRSNQLATELDDARGKLKEITSPATKWVAMAGEEAPQASAKLVWDTKSQTWIIYIYNLPEPPSDKDYQLWYVTKDAKISAAVFRPNTQGEYELKLTLPPDVVKGLAATAVTLEPKGGSQQPTGNIFLKGVI